MRWYKLGSRTRWGSGSVRNGSTATTWLCIFLTLPSGYEHWIFDVDIDVDSVTYTTVVELVPGDHFLFRFYQAPSKAFISSSWFALTSVGQSSSVHVTCESGGEKGRSIVAWILNSGQKAKWLWMTTPILCGKECYEHWGLTSCLIFLYRIASPFHNASLDAAWIVPVNHW